MSGRVISHYELEGLLGEGAMGRVYRARDTILERRVALKLVGGTSPADPTFTERFLREARLAAQLNHPNIATVYEFGVEQGEAFLVMELVEGESLADRLQRGPLAVAEVRRWGAQAAAALATAHAAGIVHRDVKPGNLMITRHGLLKVMDFGIARRASDVHLTTEGTIVGTPKTMAPEILRGEEPGPAADLFSLGCVLYEALAGGPPFAADDALAVLYQIAQVDPPSLAELRADAPPDLVAAIAGLLVKDPARRLGPAAVVATALAGEGTGRASELLVPAGGDETIALSSETVRSSTGIAGVPLVLPAERGAAPVPPRRTSCLRALPVVAVVILASMVPSYFALRNRDGAERNRLHAREINDRGAALAEKLTRVGLAHAPRESLDTARRCFEEAARLDPGYAVPWNNLGDLARFEGRPADAERAFRQAIALDSTYAVARLNLAAALEEQGRLADAEQEYRRAMADDSTLVQGPNNLAHLLASQGRHQEAVQVLEPALERWPETPQLWKNFGDSQAELGNLEAAESTLARSLELAPDQEEVATDLAQLAIRRGRLARAMERWGRLAGGPDSVAARAAMAKLDSLMRDLGQLGEPPAGVPQLPVPPRPVLPRDRLRRRFVPPGTPPAPRP